MASLCHSGETAKNRLSYATEDRKRSTARASTRSLLYLVALGQVVSCAQKLNVLPRFEGDGFGLKFGPHYGEKPSRASLDEVARKTKASASTG